jgi:hypothetical protein
MRYTWYEHGDGTEDVAPESYLNIGAVQLIRNCLADRRAMRPQPPITDYTSIVYFDNREPLRIEN